MALRRANRLSYTRAIPLWEEGGSSKASLDPLFRDIRVRMKAILLAGDRKGTRPVHEMNKAFLLLEGWPLLVHVLAALHQALSIETVTVIGPMKPIMEAIEKALPTFFFSKKIEVLEQKESLMENILYAYHHAVGEDGSFPPALFLPADIPLVTGAEVDDFIQKADMSQYDYCLGVTAEEVLRQFYPLPSAPGIQMPYLYLKDQVYRVNNLHIARLSFPSAEPLIQAVYPYRYQRSVWNRLMILRTLLKTDRAGKLLIVYLKAQVATLLSRAGLHSLALPFRLPLDQVEREISRVLSMRFKMIETDFGGAALDVDDATTYQTLSLLFSKWRALLSPVSRPSCPSLPPSRGGTVTASLH